MRKTILICLALTGLGQSSLAQDYVPPAPPHHIHRARPMPQPASYRFDEAVAQLTVKAATNGSTPATQQDLVAAMLLMSLRQERGI